VAALLLLVLAAPCAEAFGATPDLAARTPFTFDVSGGGFRTMTAGMAFSRALSQAFEEVGGGWNDITHLSGNSGGQWFATQFAFGQDFFDQLTHRPSGLGYKNMSDILAEFAQGYSQNVQDIHMEPFEPNECVIDSGAGPVDVAQLVKGLVNNLTAIDLPVIDWEVFTTAIVRATLPSIDTLTYDAPRPGLPNTALLQMMTVPPSVYINDSYQVYHPASFDSKGAAFNLPLYHRAPAASSALAESSPGFFFPSAGDSNAAMGFSAGYGPDSANGLTVYMAFTPPALTRVAEVMAISSAAAGRFASPATIAPFIREWLPNISAAGMQAALECLPVGLQSLAPALTLQLVQGPSGAADPPWAPTYRSFDGSYTDNSAMLNAISAMIADCEAGDASLRCAAKTFDMVVVNDHGDRPFDVFCLFNDTACPPAGTAFVSEAGVLVPSPRIFRENYPSEDQWIQYVPGLAAGLGQPMFDLTDLPEDIKAAAMAAQVGINRSTARTNRPPIVNASPAQFGTLLGQSIGIFTTRYLGSNVTAGTFHTMDNEAWSIKAGYAVNLILFDLNYPEAADPIIWPAGEYAYLAFHNVYAPIAEAQRKGALPFLKQWLVNRTISPI
jgi:hypothetical protein